MLLYRVWTPAASAPSKAIHSKKQAGLWKTRFSIEVRNPFKHIHFRVLSIKFNKLLPALHKPSKHLYMLHSFGCIGVIQHYVGQIFAQFWPHPPPRVVNWVHFTWYLLFVTWQGGVHKLRLQNLAFFDHIPPSVYIFYDLKVYKKSIFLTTYPPPLVNVVCERPLRVFWGFSEPPTHLRKDIFTT